jgi:DNA-binding transcriptional LysR family regulator
MDLRQLEFFSAVAGELNFTRAADRLTIAQSAVSAGVRSLESELGVELFDRSRRQIRLTSTGELLLPKVRDALDAVRRSRVPS